MPRSVMLRSTMLRSTRHIRRVRRTPETRVKAGCPVWQTWTYRKTSMGRVAPAQPKATWGRCEPRGAGRSEDHPGVVGRTPDREVRSVEPAAVNHERVSQRHREAKEGGTAGSAEPTAGS